MLRNLVLLTGCLAVSGSLFAQVRIAGEEGVSAGNALAEAVVAGKPKIKCPNPGIYCLDVYDPVTCANGVTYPNACYARWYGCQTDCTGGGAAAIWSDPDATVSFALTPEAGDGLDLESAAGGDVRDFSIACAEVIAPVMAADGEVYPNACYAAYYGGQTDFVPLVDESGEPLLGPDDFIFVDPADGDALGGKPNRPCRIRGVFCLDVYDPVLCSDGNIYPNACYAYIACQTDCVPVGGPLE